jgi:hypothetical protein
MDLATLLDALHRHGHCATYGAVGGVVGRLPRSVMHGLPKSHRHSWVVAKRNGLPTSYTTDEVDPRLSTSARPIESAEALRRWLAAQP